MTRPHLLSILSVVQDLSSISANVFSDAAYDGDMQKANRPPLAKRLAELRQAAGLSQVQLAERVEVNPSNIAFWELSGTPPRGEVLPKLAQALGVSVDELLGVTPPKPKRTVAKGRLQQVFEEASKLPRRQQQKIVEMAEGFIALHKSSNGKAA